MDRQLACMPISSAEGQAYLKAMAATSNFAFCNRWGVGVLGGTAEACGHVRCLVGALGRRLQLCLLQQLGGGGAAAAGGWTALMQRRAAVPQPMLASRAAGAMFCMLALLACRPMLLGCGHLRCQWAAHSCCQGLMAWCPVSALHPVCEQDCRDELRSPGL